MQGRRIRFYREKSPVEGITVFNIVGHPFLVGEMFEFCDRRRYHTYEVQMAWGEHRAIYRLHHAESWNSVARDTVLVSMDVAMPNEYAEIVREAWEPVRFWQTPE